jgi:hypothetical protein
MADQPNDFMRSLQELITNSASDQIRASRQFNDLVQSIARGELNDREVNERVRQFLTEAASRYVNDMSQLAISFFQAMRTVNRHYSDHFYDHVKGSSSGHAPESENGTLQRVGMTLTAAVGEDIQQSFIIENRQDQARDVSFAVSEFAESGSSTSFRAPLQLQPSRFSLRPHSEQVVTMVLPLLPELFTPGKQYTGTVLVSGHENLMLSLLIDVQASRQTPMPGSDLGIKIHANGNGADKLTRLKGIGPTYAEALTRVGVVDFAALAQVDEAYIQDKLGSAALRQARRFDWRGQARLAAEGNESALMELKAHLPLDSKNGKI